MIYGNPDGNFFDDNRDLIVVPEVRALVDVYGSNLAGRYMWAIWYVHHPSSTIFELDPQDKIEWVKQTYLEDPDFEWPEKKIVVKVRPKRGKKKPAKKGRKGKTAVDEFFDEEEEMGVEVEMNDDGEIDIERMKLTGFNDTDLMFELTGVHREFYDVIEVFPRIAMSIEERSYYGLVNLRDLAMERAKWLNGKDMAAAIRQIAGANADLEKMKEKYLSWKNDQGSKSGGDVQSGWASTRKKS